MGRKAETVWLCVLAAQLALVMSHGVFATQDGGTHLANAIALRDWNAPGARYPEFFERRSEPIPNWTTHAALAGLTLIVDPLVAEKIWVGVCLVAFAVGCRLLVGGDALGASSTVLALVFGLSRGLWLGFYNFVLGCGLTFGFLAWAARPGFLSNWLQALTACGFLSLLYTTHLTGWVLSLTGAMLFLLRSPGDRWIRLALAAAPSVAAGALFLSAAPSPGLRPLRHALRRSSTTTADMPLAALANEWFPHSGEASLWLAATVLLILVTLISRAWWMHRADREVKGHATYPLPLLTGFLALAALAAFASGQEVTDALGGYLPTRLAILAPVLLLAAAKSPSGRASNAIVMAVALVLNAFAVGSSYRYLTRANDVVTEFTQGVARVGTGRTIVMLRGPSVDPSVDPVNVGHYLFRTGNVNVDNYEAGTTHFPLRYRAGVRQAVREMLAGRRPFWTDAVLHWNGPEGPMPSPSNYDEVLRSGRLRVWVRRGDAPVISPPPPDSR